MWLKDADYEDFHELFNGIETKVCYQQSGKGERIYTYLEFETQLFFCTLCYLKKKAYQGIEFDVAENLHVLSIGNHDTWNYKFNPNCSVCCRTLFDNRRAEDCFFCIMKFAAHNHLSKKYDFIPVCEYWEKKEEYVNEIQGVNREMDQQNEAQDQQNEGIDSD